LIPLETATIFKETVTNIVPRLKINEKNIEWEINKLDRPALHKKLTGMT